MQANRDAPPLLSILHLDITALLKRTAACVLCCAAAPGVVPACASLDCLTVFARSVHDGAAIMAVMERGDAGPADVWRRSSPLPLTYSPGPGAPFRFGVPGPEFLEWTGPGGQAVGSGTG